jgi:hypothetical protein
MEPEFLKRFTRLKWECLRIGVSLEILEYSFAKPLIYKQLEEDLTMRIISDTLMRKKMNQLKKYVKQELVCTLHFDQY